VTSQDDALESALASVRAAQAAGDFHGAVRACEDFERRHGPTPQVLRLQGAALDGLGDYGAALTLARRAVDLRPRNVRARLRLARTLWRNGHIDAALAEVGRVADTAGRRGGALLRAGDFFHEVGAHEAAYRCRVRALESQPDDAAALAAVGDSAAALGRFEEAVRHYDRAMFVDPERLALLERRARLRVRGPEEHQAAQVGYVLDRLDRDDPRRAPVAYALAQELEDLGHHAPAFDLWTEGARCRRLALNDDPEAALRWLSDLMEVFDRQWLGSSIDRERTPGGATPVFVTGLPGCGLEWVADALAAVPGAAVLREQGFFADALTRLAGPTDDRRARTEAAARVPPGRLADAYRQAAGQRAAGAHPVIDVSSDHWSLLGPIRAAFPTAPIVYVRRDPLDHCLELFTTLFPRGHGWSYDLGALARYYVLHHQLMGHWRRQLPGGFLDLDLELLVARPAEARRLLADTLGFDVPGTADPSETSPLAVRGPRVGRWRAYEPELEPLLRRLRADGVPAG
jgi:tetratricopeptide (TPR) repeat protein